MSVTYARIKMGVMVSQDFASYTWPKVPCPQRECIGKSNNNEQELLSSFFDRVFCVKSKSESWPLVNESVLCANGFGNLTDDTAMHGNGSLFVESKDLVPATEQEYHESEKKISEYIAKQSLEHVMTQTQTCSSNCSKLQQLVERVVAENREICCRRKQVQDPRCQYAFVILKPTLEMFEDDNCDGGGYRTWHPSMDDLLACDWYEIEDINLNQVKGDGND